MIADMKKVRTAVGTGVILACAYLLLWPAPIDPWAWNPPVAPLLAGPFEPNKRLAAVERLGEGLGIGPEDVDVDDQGRIYAGFRDGRVMRLQGDGGRPETFADTGGVPLGMRFDAQKNLVVADAEKGLLSIDPEGRITVLASTHGGTAFGFTNDVDIAADGTIYFSDASSKLGIEGFQLELLDHGPNGRLLAYEPDTQSVRLLLGELTFANGVALAPDESFVLVNETGSYRTVRYWLTGPAKGSRDVFIDNLPGFPDGISTGTGGIFWIALASPRNALVDLLAPWPFARKVLSRLPQVLLPAPERHGFVLGVDGNGRVVHNLQHHAPDSYSPIASIQEHDGMLYLGSFAHPGLARIRRPE